MSEYGYDRFPVSWGKEMSRERNEKHAKELIKLFRKHNKDIRVTPFPSWGSPLSCLLGSKKYIYNRLSWPFDHRVYTRVKGTRGKNGRIIISQPYGYWDVHQLDDYGLSYKDGGYYRSWYYAGVSTIFAIGKKEWLEYVNLEYDVPQHLIDYSDIVADFHAGPKMTKEDRRQQMLLQKPEWRNP